VTHFYVRRKAAISLVIVGVVAVLSGALVSSGSTATHRVDPRGFNWPGSPGISCSITKGKTLGTNAFCIMFHPPQTATLYADGHVVACYGTKGGAACLSNPDAGFLPTLPYGRSTGLGPFRCASLRKGMRCVVVHSGHGFLINRSGIAHF
jgi:hypothetical protein